MTTEDSDARAEGVARPIEQEFAVVVAALLAGRIDGRQSTLSLTAIHVARLVAVEAEREAAEHVAAVRTAHRDRLRDDFLPAARARAETAEQQLADLRASIAALVDCPHGPRHYYALDATCQRCEMPSWVEALIRTTIADPSTTLAALDVVRAQAWDKGASEALRLHDRHKAWMLTNPYRADQHAPTTGEPS